MTDARDADWLEVCRRATVEIARLLADAGANDERLELTGSRGEGGDRTLVIDAAAEAAVFAELDRVHAAGGRFTAVSEERGEVDFTRPPTGADDDAARDPAAGGPGTGHVRVVIDPIDGSTNAKRGLGHYALSVAVADGPTMGDVLFAYVFDFGPEEEWVARRGEGAWLDRTRIDPDVGERVGPDGRLELLGIESADPRKLLACGDALVGSAYRLRAIGAMAITLCSVGAARLDGMVTLARCRAVDVAAGQLIVREAGGVVAFVDYEDPLGAPLDLEPHSRLIAARSAATLTRLRALAP